MLSGLELNGSFMPAGGGVARIAEPGGVIVRAGYPPGMCMGDRNACCENIDVADDGKWPRLGLRSAVGELAPDPPDADCDSFDEPISRRRPEYWFEPVKIAR